MILDFGFLGSTGDIRDEKLPTIVLQAGATPVCWVLSTENSHPFKLRLSCWQQNICRMSSEVVSDGTPPTKAEFGF